MNTHLHIAAWVVAFILLFAVVLLYKKGNEKAGKIVQMVLRLFYLVILISGIQLLWMYFHGSDKLIFALLKAFAGLWVVASMEMVSVKTSKGNPTGASWVQVLIAFVVTVILGYGVLS